MISARTAANCIAAAGLAGASVLLRFSPQEYSFYPRCPFYALTGHYCPGCGATRAIAELLHGHVAAALHFNAAVTLLLPMLLWYFGTMYWTAVQDNRVVAASPAVVMESRACLRLALWRSKRFGINDFLRSTETESCFRRAFDD